MKVKELKEKLKDVPDDYEVNLNDSCRTVVAVYSLIKKVNGVNIKTLEIINDKDYINHGNK